MSTLYVLGEAANAVPAHIIASTIISAVTLERVARVAFA